MRGKTRLIIFPTKNTNQHNWARIELANTRSLVKHVVISTQDILIYFGGNKYDWRAGFKVTWNIICLS